MVHSVQRYISEKLNNDKIGEKVLQLGNNDIGFNNTAKIITSLSCRRNE